MSYSLPDNVEVSLLGSLMRSGYDIFNHIHTLSPTMFSSTVHQHIFRAMKNLANRGTEPSPLLIKTELNRLGTFKLAGGDDYIDFVYEHAGKQSEISEYVDRVKDYYKIRALHSIGSRIPSSLESKSPDIVINNVSTLLDKLLTETGGFDVMSVGDTLDGTMKKIRERMKNPGIKGISTGFPEVDYFTAGLVPGEIWYIGSRPSMGKSALALKMGANVARQGYSVAMFNREMLRDDVNERLLSMVSSVALQDIRLGTLNEHQASSLETCVDDLYSLPIYVDNNFSGGIDYITATIRKLKQLYDIKVVFIDYIQLIVERSMESTHALGNASRALKLLTEELDITTVILSQVNRSCEQRENKRPLMSDLRQSGNLEEDADIMVALYRDSVYTMNIGDGDILEFIIRKSRNGGLGVIDLNFNQNTTNIYNKEDVLWNEKP